MPRDNQLDEIITPWTPYSVQFSHDGQYLLVGGGTWYGQGGILLYELAQKNETLYSLESLDLFNATPTISGLFLTTSNHLLASSWSMRQNYAPVLLYDWQDGELDFQQLLHYTFVDNIGSPCPTGIIVHNNRIVVRHEASEIKDTLKILRHNDVHHEESSGLNSNLVTINNQVFTGGGGSLALAEWRVDTGMKESGKSAQGLVCLDLENEEVSPMPVVHCDRITAVGRLDNKLMTGGLWGEIDHWYADNEQWQCHHIQTSKKKNKPKNDALTWATYTASSIIGFCSINPGLGWASLDTSGELNIWQGQKVLNSYQLPGNGTPRCMAAHPFLPLLAIGVKQGGFAKSKSKIVLVDLSKK